MCPLLAMPHARPFLLQPFTVLTRQTRQAVRAIEQSISLDVYAQCQSFFYVIDTMVKKLERLSSACLISLVL